MGDASPIISIAGVLLGWDGKGVGEISSDTVRVRVGWFEISSDAVRLRVGWGEISSDAARPTGG